MISLTTADSALKSVYLGVIGNQLNIGANPLLTRIKQTTNNVYGNEIRKTTSYGISGGVSAGTESGALPQAINKGMLQFKLTLKNLYGTIEITDKAIRCSQNSAGAFVNLLNDEMENLIKSSSFNLGRMLYGNGNGILATVSTETNDGDTYMPLDHVKYLAINSACKFVNPSATTYTNDPAIIINEIDRANKRIRYDRLVDDNYEGYKLATLTGLNNEISGLGRIFDQSATLYDVNKELYPWMNPYQKASVGEISETAMQTAIDEIEEVTGGEIDFISCSSAVRRAYQECVSAYKKNIDVMNLEGGFKALSYNGIPVVADRFVGDGEMYLLSTKDFELCQLGDWQWLEGNDGKIIKQKEGYPIFTATLVKYAELLCNRPNSQAKLSGITGA